MSRSTGMCESDQARMGMHALAAEAAPTGPTGSRPFAAKAAPTGRSYRPLPHGELFDLRALRTLLSTADLPQHRCDDGAANSSTDEFKQ